MFYNCHTDKFEDTAVEQSIPGRWYIRSGFCGFNSPANNRMGYDSKAKAEAAIRRYESRSDYIASKRAELQGV
jgi:hypothetical protein